MITNTLSEENMELRNNLQIQQQRIDKLEQQFEWNKQRNLERDIEIYGITNTKSENLELIVKELLTSLDIKEPNCIHNIYRKRLTNAAGDNSSVIVSFRNKETRDQVMINKKGKNLAYVGGDNPSIVISTGENVKDERPVYINENITSFKKLLFKKARDVKKTRAIKYAWVKNGNVLIRVSDGSRTIHIKSSDQLDDYSQ